MNTYCIAAGGRVATSIYCVVFFRMDATFYHMWGFFLTPEESDTHRAAAMHWQWVSVEENWKTPKKPGSKKLWHIYNSLTEHCLLIDGPTFFLYYRRVTWIFVFPSQISALYAVFYKFCINKKSEKNLGNYCTSKVKFPHFNFPNYPH